MIHAKMGSAVYRPRVRFAPSKKLGFREEAFIFFYPALVLGVPGRLRILNQIETVNVMSQFEKRYIGKGTQVKDLDIIRVSIPGGNPKRPHGRLRWQGISGI